MCGSLVGLSLFLQPLPKQLSGAEGKAQLLLH